MGSAPLANGLYCASPDHCESASCVLGFCSSGGVGESCTPTDACATEDLVCMDSKCQAKLDDGQYCGEDGGICASALCVTSFCTSGADGQTCDPAAACEAELVCLDGRCRAKLPDGQFCV